MLSRSEMVETLKESVVEVEFTKSNGENRKMKCTLLEEYLPVKEVKEGDENKPARKKSETSISVWDVEAIGWRSFKIDSLISFNIVE